MSKQSMTDNKIICAISTAPGMGAIAVIRVSGQGSIELVDKIFRSPSNKTLTQAKGNTVLFGSIVRNNALLDEVLVTVFRAPHSFTGEDGIEIACHGSVYIQQQLLQLLVDTGAHIAAPGEFSKRAFLNGKMDLSQAEAVADLISSSSAASHRMALNQMKGGFSTELISLRGQLLHLTTLLELELDFSEEDVEFADRSELTRIAMTIEQLLARLCNSFTLGNVIKNGVPVALVGNTNVGKSTLLNALLNEEKAIVSDIAGTTRDVIEDTINIEGITFRFIDTAGIRHTEDTVENIGIERTFATIGKANIVMLLTDLRDGIEQFIAYYNQVKAHMLSNARLVIVVNKTDQMEHLEDTLAQLKAFTQNEPIIPISARQSHNMDQLINELIATVNLDALNSSDVIVSNIRHYEALSHARTAIERVIAGLNSHISGEFVSQDIRECLHYLGEITGDISTDEVLGNVFKNFCIGK
ncbi:MAG: tRNA uridine-5-carboxymethylaminomethyl(34) synthesis GTPase MnmE [Marinifilaceae bacterium]